ncbi:hypothetical protein [Pontibacter actiniarum]|uniref:Uncharacterized protein n=1 Tax=Pontibacter actiniarum TaxID=323450 RepID=A0A1X9YNV8_9BACT|nr:hypothetical protein [Pontibacter actiniarum]ARS34539.1 hypothetical protein CA264_03270 [Pontibacter actiniarum]
MLEHSLFHRLPDWSKVEVLTKHGTALAQREQQDWTITLYSLQHNFYELWEKDGVEVISSFQATANPMAILHPYTEQIDIRNVIDL